MVILDLERSGWRLMSTKNCIKHVISYCLSMGPKRESGLGAAAWILWLRDEYGSFEKVSYGGRVLRNASAMTAEREALRMGIEHLTVLFPTEASSFDFHVENSSRTVQYKLYAQSLRLFVYTVMRMTRIALVRIVSKTKQNDQECGRQCWVSAQDHEARSMERRSADLGKRRRGMSGCWSDVKQRGKNRQSIGSVTKACRMWRISRGKMRS